MSRFIDLYFDDLVAGFPCYSSPRFSTTITAAASGAERRNRNWLHPLMHFRLPEAIREQDTYETVKDHWLVMGGPESTFPFRDPMDFASIALELPNFVPAWTGLDQGLGVGNGLTRVYQLTKTYSRGGETYARPIYLPVLDDLTILINGMAPGDVPPGPLTNGPYTYTVSRPGGEVTFDHALADGLVATWGGLFDVEVRFEADDTFDGIVQSYQVAGFADINLVEVRRC